MLHYSWIKYKLDRSYVNTSVVAHSYCYRGCFKINGQLIGSNNTAETVFIIPLKLLNFYLNFVVEIYMVINGYKC